MSMNLYFVTEGGFYVDFPFQTPTNLTYEVIGAPDTESRLKLISNQLVEWGWSQDDRLDMIDEVSRMMKDTSLTLDYL